MTKSMNIDDLILLADAFVLPVDVKVSHGLFRRGVSLGSVLRSIKTHAQCQTATAYDEGNMEEIARDSDLAEIEALRRRIDFASDALGVVERRRDTLKAERDTARAALRIFVSRAKSWHDFHHGSDTIQCDALCEAIPIGEAALGSPPEPNDTPRFENFAVTATPPGESQCEQMTELPIHSLKCCRIAGHSGPHETGTLWWQGPHQMTNAEHQSIFGSPKTVIGCVCGEPNRQGVQHRTDGPCFVITRP